MPNDKLIRITKTPQMPTIKNYFTTMAERQGKEIRRLRQLALGEVLPAPSAELPTNRAQTRGLCTPRD